jgi:hypothetical protein
MQKVFSTLQGQYQGPLQKHYTIVKAIFEAFKILKNSNPQWFFEKEKFFDLFFEGNSSVFSIQSEQNGDYKTMADCYSHFMKFGISFLIFDSV